MGLVHGDEPGKGIWPQMRGYSGFCEPILYCGGWVKSHSLHRAYVCSDFSMLNFFMAGFIVVGIWRTMYASSGPGCSFRQCWNTINTSCPRHLRMKSPCLRPTLTITVQ